MLSAYSGQWCNEKIRPEIIEMYKKTYEWLVYWGKSILKVLKVSVKYEHIYENVGSVGIEIILIVEEKNKANGHFYINNVGLHRIQNRGDTIPFFEIVELVE